MSLLEVRNLKTAYGQVVVHRDLSITVGEGEIVTILGPNGAGKSTLLRAISGLLRPRGGTIHFGGVDTTTTPADRAVRMGIVMVPEGRRVFADMTVGENLRIGAYGRRERSGIEADVRRMEEIFSILGEKRHEKAGGLSGGQQQMLAIARGLMARPRILLLDEPSLGLSPRLVKELRGVIMGIREQFAAAVLLVEQNASLALAVAQRGYLLHNGRVVASGPIDELRDDRLMRDLYLGEAQNAAAPVR